MYFETNIDTISLLLEAVITCVSFTRLNSIFKFHGNGTFSSISMFPFSVQNKNSSDAKVVCSDYGMKYILFTYLLYSLTQHIAVRYIST